MGRTLKEPGQSRALSLPTRRPPITRRRESPQALRACYQQASGRVHRGQTPSDIFATASALCSSIPDAQDLPVECGTVPKHGIASRRQRVQGRCVRVDPVCRLLMTASGAGALASIALRSPSTIRDGSRARAKAGRILA
jgi:hypothetical protein